MSGLTGEQIANEAMAQANALLAVEGSEVPPLTGLAADLFELGAWYGMSAAVQVLRDHGMVVDPQ